MYSAEDLVIFLCHDERLIYQDYHYVWYKITKLLATIKASCLLSKQHKIDLTFDSNKQPNKDSFVTTGIRNCTKIAVECYSFTIMSAIHVHRWMPSVEQEKRMYPWGCTGTCL